MLSRILTIGVYGFDANGFFQTLERAGVDTFCDIRFRRAVRGSDYAFVNSRRLQARLTELGIRYCHFRELAPSPAVRRLQAVADKAARTAKRTRSQLSAEFIAAYRDECLNHFQSREFVEQLGIQARVIALFCVEREPAACHRSLLAQRLHQDLGVEVADLTPP